MAAKRRVSNYINNMVLLFLLFPKVVVRRLGSVAWTSTSIAINTIRQPNSASNLHNILKLQLPQHGSVHQQQRQLSWFHHGTSIRKRYFASTSETAIDIDSSSTSSSNEKCDSNTGSSERLSKQNLSLELRTVVDHLDIVVSHLIARNSPEETIKSAETIAALSNDRLTLIRKRDLALQRRKECSAIVGKLMRLGDSNLTAEQKQELESAKELSTKSATEAEEAETKLDTIQASIDALLANIPNLLDDIVPNGNDDNDNYEVFKWGDIEKLPTLVKERLQNDTNDFQPKWHDEVATGLGGYLSDAAIKMSGTRFVALSGVVAQLERSLAMFLLDQHTTVNKYTEVSVPYIVSRSSLYGTTQLPKFQDDLFAITPSSHKCNGEDAFLIPTAEVPLTNLHRDCILEEEQLPLSYVAYTPCFRAEAGSYGRDTRGLIRQHQFSKVELVKITTQETSADQHELLTSHAEQCLQLLELPYRKVRLCSGDIGFAAQHCYDLEVWLPGSGEYREISSCSNTGDFQARRMQLRYRPKSSSVAETADDNSNKKKKKNPNQAKPVFCHTINGSGLAVGRTLVAVLENYQMPDGSVIVPTVLRPYMGGKEVLLPA